MRENSAEILIQYLLHRKEGKTHQEACSLSKIKNKSLQEEAKNFFEEETPKPSNEIAIRNQAGDRLALNMRVSAMDMGITPTFLLNQAMKYMEASVLSIPVLDTEGNVSKYTTVPISPEMMQPDGSVIFMGVNYGKDHILPDPKLQMAALRQLVELTGFSAKALLEDDKLRIMLLKSRRELEKEKQASESRAVSGVSYEIIHPNIRKAQEVPVERAN